MNTDTIKDWLARKTELAKEAQNAPWRVGNDGFISGDRYVLGIAFYEHVQGAGSWPIVQGNQKFIADSRTTTPLALEIARLAVECLEEAHAEFERVHKVKDYNTTFSNTLQQIQTLIES